jgi:hypothetical protein
MIQLAALLTFRRVFGKKTVFDVWLTRPPRGPVSFEYRWRGTVADPCRTNRFTGSQDVPSSERQKELKRRRHRRKKVALFARKLQHATVSERAGIADKLRKMTPGGQVIIDAWDLEKR